jgi:hypothetical protein
VARLEATTDWTQDTDRHGPWARRGGTVPVERRGLLSEVRLGLRTASTEVAAGSDVRAAPSVPLPRPSPMPKLFNFILSAQAEMGAGAAWRVGH